MGQFLKEKSPASAIPSLWPAPLQHRSAAEHTVYIGGNPGGNPEQTWQNQHQHDALTHLLLIILSHERQWQRKADFPLNTEASNKLKFLYIISVSRTSAFKEQSNLE